MRNLIKTKVSSNTLLKATSTQSRDFCTQSKLYCGFVSILSPKGSVKKIKQGASWESKLQKGLDTIKHRGPESSHIWVDKNEKVALGHARLSIIDLTTGDQPLSNQDNTVHVVVNGEIYDYERIRQDLIQKGYSFKTKSDSEIVLALYQEYGTQMFKYLRGEFAFTLWDSKAGILLAAKDRFGIKPLFYTIQKDGTVLFASEMKAFFEMGVKCEWDEQSVVFPNTSGTRTIFKNVYQLPPAHYAIIPLNDPNSMKLTRYWDLDYSHKDQIENRTEQEMVSGVRNLLEESVTYRLRADVPVGVYLSGGIDSCALLGLSNKILREKYHTDGSIDAFTLSFKDHKAYDEASVAKKQAALCGAKYREVPITQKELADNFEDATYHCENPMLQTNFVAKYLLSRAVRDAGYKVVMTGEGSDEIFCGYPWFKIDMLSDTDSISSDEMKEIMDHLIQNNVALRHILSKPNETDHVKKLLGSQPFFMTTFSNSFKEVLKSKYKPTKEQEGALARHRMMELLEPHIIDKMKNKWSNVHTSMYVWARSVLPAYLLTHLGDRSEMAHSVEGRVPFLDHHLVEFVNQLPLSIKLKPDLSNKVLIEKYVLREATKDVITEEVYKRVKHPFTSPPATWNKEGELYQFMQQTLRSADFEKQPFYDKKKIEKMLNTVHSAQDQTVLQEFDTLMIYLTSVVLLQKRYNPSTSRK